MTQYQVIPILKSRGQTSSDKLAPRGRCNDCEHHCTEFFGDAMNACAGSTTVTLNTIRSDSRIKRRRAMLCYLQAYGGVNKANFEILEIFEILPNVRYWLDLPTEAARERLKASCNWSKSPALQIILSVSP
jgi:hypothetical protein